MRVKYLKFNKLFIILLFVVFVFITTFNYLVDPFYIYKTKLINNFNAKKSQIKNQERITKIFEFKLDKNKYNAIFIGSSKVDFALDPSYYEKITGKKAKNLAMVGTSLEENIDIAKRAINAHPEIKKIYFGLDFFIFGESYAPAYSSPNKESIINEILTTLFSIDATKAAIDTVKTNKDKKFEPKYNNDGLLIKTFDNIPERFEEFLKEYYEKQYIKYKLSRKRIKEVSDFYSFCKQKRIDLVLFISPFHSSLLQTIKEANAFDSYKQWKKELVKISPIYDFSFPNDINTEKITYDMKNYVDAAHVVVGVGNKELDKLVLNEGDFGSLITIDNVDKYNKLTEEKLKKWALKNQDWVKKIEELTK